MTPGCTHPGEPAFSTRPSTIAWTASSFASRGYICGFVFSCGHYRGRFPSLTASCGVSSRAMEADELFHDVAACAPRYLISRRRFAAGSFAALGTRTVSTPFSKFASARSRSTPEGSGITRWNCPNARSTR
jgi:hypothetical protein